MKKNKVKQVLLLAVGGLTCGVQLLGCYPVVPAYFAAAVLEDVSVFYLTAAMYLSMLCFMPLVAMTKYAMAVLVTACMIRLVVWANDGCPAFLGGILAAVSTMLLSFCGGLLEWKDQPDQFAVFLEGVFVFGMVILLNRAIHFFLEEWNLGWEKTTERDEWHLTERGKEERLAGYAESFQGLAQIFMNMSRKKEQYTAEELGKIQNELTGRLCAGCDSCAVCWEKESTPLYGILSSLLGSILKAGVPGEESEEELALYCKRSRDMVEEAVRVFEKANLNRAWYNRLLENRQAIAEQLDAMAYILKDCAKEEQLLDGRERRTLAQIKYRAKEHGITVEEVHLFELPDGHKKLEAVLRSKKGGCIAVRQFMGAAGRVLGFVLRQPADGKSFVTKDAAAFLFYEDTKFQSLQGIARQKKDGAQISGDNFSFLELESGKLLLGLSDGMGSGSVACRESEMVLDLIERFLEAGFTVDTAIRMMNSAMVMKGESDQYSTVDLCTVNLYDGEAELYKIGAATGFLKREKEVIEFHVDSLPVGVENNLKIDHKKMQLKNGDFIVMVTDGVLEYLHVPKPEETMQEILESIDTNHPGILAKKAMERVLLFTGGKVPDDMTILAAGIREK